MPTSSKSQERITEKIKSGEFFRESLHNYHLNYHDPMTDRYFFVGITVICVLIFLLSLTAIILLHPLQKEVPFIYSSEDIVKDYPRIKALGTREEDPNYVLKRFLVGNYVQLREEYQVDLVERSALGIKSQSTQEVYQTYQQLMNPRNPESPIARFQRQAIRKVEPLRFTIASASGNSEQMTVEYKEQVISGADISTRRMRAIITFRFDDIQVNQKTGAVSPLKFQVMDYTTKAAN